MGQGGLMSMLAGVACGLCIATGMADEPVLARIVDDFPAGVANWTNEDTGTLEHVSDGPGGGHLRWRAADDGIGRIRFRHPESLDCSAYDTLRFRYRVSGKTLNNINPIIQQYPFMQGYKAQYWAVDTLQVRLGEWQTWVQELGLVENSWPDSYSRTNQIFMFEIHQEPGAEQMTLELDDIVLERNLLGLDRTYPGVWEALPDGAQRYVFSIPVSNRLDRAVTVRVAPDTNSFVHAQVTPMPAVLELAGGGAGTVDLQVLFPADVIARMPVYYGELISLRFEVDADHPLTFSTLLPSGVRPAQTVHPAILCDAEHALTLRRQYLDPESRKTMDPILLTIMTRATKALAHTPSYPPLANRAIGYTQCLMDNAKLETVTMPNLPEATYQCPECGRFYRGMFYQAAMENWFGQHFRNAEAASDAGMGYLLTGDMQYARKAAAILTDYIDVYLKLPIAAGNGVHAPIISSGASRIGGSYMQEVRWLTSLAVALDCIRESGVLSAAELEALSLKVFEPSATLMMDHRVGLMNLQWMISRAAVFAGMATENPALVARALYGSHGIVRLMEEGFLKDGFWRENPSYINVMANEGYPVLGTLFGNGILPYTPEQDLRYKALWRLVADDRIAPTLGTGVPAGLALLFNGVKAIAHLSDDPEIAWIDRNYPQVKNVGMYFSCVIAAFQAKGTRLPPGQERPIVPKTENLSDYGVAVLRVPGSDAYAALAWGRHLVHGHFNKLSVNAYGKGGWFMRNVFGAYGAGFSEYLEATAGSSTLMVDGRSQDADTGELLMLEDAGAIQMASAREVGAWKDVEHERSVVLTADWMLVLDRVVSDQPHTYDWLYHGQAPGKGNSLEWSEGPALQQDAVPTLGEAACYPFFEPVEARQAAAPMSTVLYRRPDRSGAAVSLLNGKRDLTLFRTGNSKWPHEGLIVRRSAADAAFVALFEPLGKAEPQRFTVEDVVLLDAQTGLPAGLRDAQGAVLSGNGQRILVVVNYSGSPLKTADGRQLPRGRRVQAVVCE